VEPHRSAAEAAAHNLPGARVLAGCTAERFLEREHALSADALVITDPPRSGLSATVRRALTHQRPRRIVMLGCAPDTWARDARELAEHGYGLAQLELFDLFPSTHHIEILALLELS
jgi:tRNA/tmRNA/rRNA uracil-C5-methylase (TrmA/RlmC/RlmD family)